MESTCTRFNTSARRRTRPSAGHERSQQLQISLSLNSQAILQRVRLLFLQRQHWRAPNFSAAPTLAGAWFFCCANLGGRLVFPWRQHYYGHQYFPMRRVFTIRQRFWVCRCFLNAPMFFVHTFRRLYFCILFCILI